jgi:multicomponent Na+:H+ antiporter subunit D
LIGHTGTKEARNSGRVYLGILMGTSVCFLLPAIVMTYHAAGTLDFVSGGVLPEELTPAFIAILLALFVFGIGKAAVMPFHRWLPAAMVAPTPVSALLHAVAVVKAGVFSIVKVMVYIFGYERLVFQHDFVGWSVEWLTYIACFTIISASVVALYQDSLKKRLAYSTIGQLSYVVLAASTFSPIAMVAAIFHIVAHAFSKITLFFAAGAIYTASGKKYISQLDGIARQMPWTMTAFAVGALSMIAVPPTVGFVSKWYMFVGAFSNANYLVIATLVISTILNAMYFLPIVFRAFFKKPSGKVASCGEAPLPSVIALVVTAFMTLFWFVYPDMVISFAANVLGVRE